MPLDADLLAQAQAQGSQARPCIFVLFGATGDLAARKIAPALYNLWREGLLNDRTIVLGVARRPRSDQQFRDEMRKAIESFSRTKLDEQAWNAMAGRWFYHVVEAGHPEHYKGLAKRLEELDSQFDTGGNRLFYMATGPELFAETADQLAAVGLNKSARKDSFSRLVIEKPFGSDLPTARALNRRLAEHWKEAQLYRIDHYLGKQTVQNLLVFRFANAIIEPLLCRNLVDHVQISTTETVGMEGRRGPFYESAGALRDMAQSHMLQLMSLIAMDPPSCLRCDDIRNEKVKLLRAIEPLRPEQVARYSVRGQYAAAGDSPGYRQEKGVAPDSQVETYAAVRLMIDNWRWAGVPFFLRTGKNLAAKMSRITVVFRREPTSLFNISDCDIRSANQLVIRISPQQGISFRLDAKTPGPWMIIRPVNLALSYEQTFGSGGPEAYESLLLDAVLGDQVLFIRADEAEACWRVIDSIRSAWDVSGQPALDQYPAGSWGPEAAEAIFDDPYRRWQNL